MATLARDLRKELERTVKQARRVAEAGARKAVEQLGVGEGEAPRHLSSQQQALRRRLRAHGRQLGDRRDDKRGAQAVGRLIQECAYEHWHRMLFARFLAETDLLIEPQSGVAITLDEVQELAREKSSDWLELASDYAERMLPQIFRKDDPVLDIALPPETRSELEDLLKELPRGVFVADDSLGWVYQFWQAERKDEVNKSEKKIGADELPAVTQLFTEDYMVLFLLHNTLGAWWAGKVLATRPELAASAKDEDELRAACKVRDVEWTYLRFVRESREDGADGPWRPAAGTFNGWPKAAKEITVLDPCMGSGHFLVIALPILVAFRVAEEKLSREAAVDAVLRDNLFGLEIDPRCTQIAAFNLAFAAWRMVGYRLLPRLNLACSGLAIGVTKAEWLKLAERAAELADPGAKRDIFGLEKNLITSGISERAKNGLDRFYDLFAKAPWLGSLIDPRRVGGDIFSADFAQLEPLLAAVLSAADSDEVAELAVAARGMAKAGELLGRQFVLVTTNVPYLTKGKMDEFLQSHCDTHHPFAKYDLSTCFVERSLALVGKLGAIAIVTPHNWLMLKSYAKLRAGIIKNVSISFVAQLGFSAFQIMDWWAFNTSLLIVLGNSAQQDHTFVGIDASSDKSQSAKANIIANNSFVRVLQCVQAANPDSRITFHDLGGTTLLNSIASAPNGSHGGDGQRHRRKFWEIPQPEQSWRFFQGPPDKTKLYAGRIELFSWFDAGNQHFKNPSAYIKGQNVWGSWGVAISVMRQLPATIYTGELFDISCTPIVPMDPAHLPAIWAFCSSPQYVEAVRKIDPKLNVTNATLAKVPFDLEHWRRVAAEEYPHGLPKPCSNDPTQWLFDGNPKGAAQPLQVAVARLLGYPWPRKSGSSFPECSVLDADELERYANIDGIVCLSAIKGESSGDRRLNALLGDSFGADWSSAKLGNLLAEVGFAGKTLDDWLRDGFFQQHCELFHQRPFVWHVWDGRRDGFNALVNYHRLAAPGDEGRRTLEKLLYTYLGNWIDRQRMDQKGGVEGADGRRAAAEHLRSELIKILEGERPYDIFIRWKSLNEQPIGWEPDINDGVRINIRPFMTARTLNGKSASACILRTTPRIKWEKDRGKEPTRDKDDYPWFWSWDETTQDFAGDKTFDGNRWNDLHCTRAFKQAARDRHRNQSANR